MKTHFKFILCFLILFVIAGCAKKESLKTQVKTHHGIGVVQSVDQENGTVSIAHEEIAGFMGAMTMRFRVENKSILIGIQPEQKVNFTITQNDTGFFISDIRKTINN